MVHGRFVVSVGLNIHVAIIVGQIALFHLFLKRLSTKTPENSKHENNVQNRPVAGVHFVHIFAIICSLNQLPSNFDLRKGLK